LARFARLGPLCAAERVQNSRNEPHSGANTVARPPEDTRLSARESGQNAVPRLERLRPVAVAMQELVQPFGKGARALWWADCIAQRHLFE
jgi:hypothetical protein